MVYILILIILLTTVNGFFAGAEMALVKLTPQQLSKWDGKTKRYVSALKAHSTKYLSTIQVMITFAGFLSSAFAGANLKADFSNLLALINIPVSETVSLVIVTFLLSYFTLVFGELVPKRIALSNHELVARISAPVVYYSMIITTPFVWLLTKSTRGVLSVFGYNKKDSETDLSEADIKETILYGYMLGLYGKQETAIMKRVFQFDDLTAKMVMTPLDKVVMIDDAIDNESVIKTVSESKLSRIPVYHGHQDAIIGVLISKDLIHREPFQIHQIMHRPLIVFEDIKINQLLRKMKASSMHLACLMTEEGQFVGIVSLEDILEEIVGNIYDEHDDVNDPIEKENEFVYYVDGDVSVATINHLLDLDLPENNQNIETLYNTHLVDGICKIKDIYLRKEMTRIKLTIKSKQIS
jgi:putative hemolysin